VAVVQTSPVAAGTYIVTGTAVFNLVTGDLGFCTIRTGTGANNFLFGGAGEAQGWAQAAVADHYTVAAGDTFVLWCYDYGSGGASDRVYDSTINAIAFNSVSATTKGNSLPPPGKP
jgi:hypothetical protein